MAKFEIIPAIDLRDGQCVRLRQGRMDEATVYSADPAAMARRWAAEGATRLHVVDLDGAMAGRPMHLDAITDIVDAVDIPVEVGGGIRTDLDISALLGAGADRVILGTRICAKPADLDPLLRAHAERIVAGIDARGGQVQVRGWTETTLTPAMASAGRPESALPRVSMRCGPCALGTMVRKAAKEVPISRITA